MYQCNFLKGIDLKTFIELIMNNRGEKTETNPDCYYHACSNLYRFASILKYGILSYRARIEENVTMTGIHGTSSYSGSNGKHYISVIQNKDSCNTYNNWIRGDVAFVIRNTIKANKTIYMQRDLPFLINKTPLPLRFSGWHDEYQVKHKITIDDLIAVQYYLLNAVKESKVEEDLLYHIFTVAQVMSLIDESEVSLPLIDGSDNTLINKDIFKSYVRVKKLK